MKKSNINNYFKKTILTMLFFLLFPSFLSFSKNGQIGEIKIRGLLVAEACTVRPGDENIIVEFGNIVDKYIYINQKTPLEQFNIHLDDCDNSIFNTVTVKFEGTENPNLPGLLALDNASMASGIGIELFENSGKNIPINSLTSTYRLENGTNILSFNANVQGEPNAIKNKSIGLGYFTATAVFNLIYD
ncbi:fimbrial protein [Providencia burhodogranariea]|uniref:Putative exported fimbrial protein n=1 Tax=Providencia burhodogranariea DSM 19968 TaxID=1141662 RepID=K8VZR5_9GAMM|nr:fimbrial protein [Providencia burhodogranariea]EKT53664.1 putative exported fimbrial protein [Providencia burhodogranariea DSM 19968]